MAADIAPFPGSIDLTSGDLAEPGPRVSLSFLL